MLRVPLPLSIASCEHEDQDSFNELDSGPSRSATDELEDLIRQVPMPMKQDVPSVSI